MQAKAMRKYHLQHPFNDSPPALPWPTNSHKIVQKFADPTRNCAKGTMHTPAESQLQDQTCRLPIPFCKLTHFQRLQFRHNEHHEEGANPPLAPQKAREGGKAKSSHLPHPPQHLSPTQQVPRQTAPPTQTTLPDHPPSHHKHRHSPKHTQNSNAARESNDPSVIMTRAPESDARGRSSTASRARAKT